MSEEDNHLERRMRRELRSLSLNEKLRYATLVVLGLPLLVLVNIVFVLRVIDLFRSDSIVAFLVTLAFASVMGIAAIGADFWLIRWFIEEVRVAMWSSGER